MRHDLVMIEIALKHILKYQPKIFVEIGSRDGNDTDYIAKTYNVNPNNCYIFEAHPECYKAILRTYPQYNVYNCAITDKTHQLEFNAGIVGIEDNIGCSSILDDVNKNFKSEKVLVDGWRFDEICTQLQIVEPDLIKIDVEGHTYEVLEGFGSMLAKTKTMQLELEHKQSWVNQKLYNELYQYLTANNFEQILFTKHSHDQSDSFWINKNYFNL